MTDIELERSCADTQWAQIPLGECARLINGRAYAASELLDRGKYPVLRVGNLFTSNHWYHSDLELEPDKYCQTEDLLFAWSGTPVHPSDPIIGTGGKAIFLLPAYFLR